MTRSVVDYENLMETSFNEANKTVRTHVRPRWEKKKDKLQAKTKGPNATLSLVTGGGVAAGCCASGTGSGCDKNNQHGKKKDRAPLANCNGGDRFIPNRAGMNMELSKHLMRSESGGVAGGSCCASTSAVGGGGGASERSSGDQQPPEPMDEDQKSVSDAKKGMYNSNLSSALLGVEDIHNSRVMSYQEKAPVPKGDTVNNLDILYSGSASVAQKKSNTKLVTRQIPSAPSRILDAPDMMDDYYLNLVSWSDTNVLAVALGQTVYLWNAATGETDELFTLDGGGPNSYISSVSWVQQGGAHIAVGTSLGATQLWDVHECKQLRSMDGHSDRVSSLAWNRHILSSGSRDTVIVNHDVRVARHRVSTLACHTQEVCGIVWSPDGEVLASGGNDNLLCLWDAAAASSRPSPRFQLTDHQAAVKALAWSPHERHLLATGGGTADRTIKFWSSRTGAVLNSIDTGSQVCALQWNPFEKEILSSHGYARNQLCLWKYPSMAKVKELEGHTSRVLYMARSPDGGTVVSGAADETLRFWDVFAPAAKKTGGMMAVAAEGIASGTASIRGGAGSRWTAQIR